MRKRKRLSNPSARMRDVRSPEIDNPGSVLWNLTARLYTV
jgi:hypothetical protein